MAIDSLGSLRNYNGDTERTTSIKDDFIFYLRISWYPKVYEETESSPH